MYIHVIPVKSYSGVFVVNFYHISPFSLEFFWLTLNYIEKTVRRLMEYRKRNLLLLEFLYNRLYPFTKRYVEETEKARAIGENRIKLLNDGYFIV